MKSLIVIVCIVALTAAGAGGSDEHAETTVEDAGTVTDAVVDAGADGAEGGDWHHPPKEGVKVLCFNWNEADPTNMHQSDCNEGPAEDGASKPVCDATDATCTEASATEAEAAAGDATEATATEATTTEAEAAAGDEWEATATEDLADSSN